jgi:hypothetical protein
MHGKPAPNQDIETGIHFGVISRNDVDPDSLEDVYSNGTDLTYESAKEEAQSVIRQAVSGINENTSEDDVLRALQNAYSAIDLPKSIAQLRDLLDEEPLTRADVAFDLIWYDVEQDWNDSYQSDESAYRYESDGLILELGTDGDIFVIKSPFYTLCAECSPCAPNAGYLTDSGIMKAYCLPEQWFNEDDEYCKLPYTVYSVADDSVVAQPEPEPDEEPTGPRCSDCSPSAINGVFCHEAGCANSGKVWSVDSQEWVKYVKCFHCGCDSEVGTYCGCCVETGMEIEPDEEQDEE